MRKRSARNSARQLVHHTLIGAVAATALVFGSAANGQTLRWASRYDILTMDPHSEIEALNQGINGQVYESLVMRDKQLKLVPGLATEWTQISPTLWRFKLRPGVKFHDGAAFTADDVVFSVKRAQQPTANQRSFALPMGEPRKIDDLTVEFALPQASPIFLSYAVNIMMMNKAWAEKNDATSTPDPKKKEVKFTLLNANGTGPFTLVSRQPDTKTVFRRNPNWWGQFEGNVQEVIFTPISSDSTRVAALLSGEVDFIRDPGPQDLPRLRSSGSTKVLDGAGNWVWWVGMDQSRDELLYSSVKGKNPFKDMRVRKALYQAIDIETLRTKVLDGQAYPTGGVTLSASAPYTDAQIEKRLPFNLAEARSLLAEAGYPQGFEVTLDCPNSLEATCLAVATMLAQIGIKARPNVMLPAISFPKLQKLDTSLFLSGWGSASTDIEPQLTSSLRPRGTDGIGLYNFGNYKNQKFDDLAVASFNEPDAAKREQLIRAALTEHKEQIHLIPLYQTIANSEYR